MSPSSGLQRKHIIIPVPYKPRLLDVDADVKIKKNCHKSGLSIFFNNFKWAFYETSTLGNKFCDLKILPRTIMSTKITKHWDGQY